MTTFSESYDINQRLYKQVAASTTETSDYIPASGETIRIINIGVSSSSVPNTVAYIAWDADGTPEILLSSYGEASQRNVHIDLVGDGVKIIRINLTNDLAEPTYLGAFWQAVKI